MLRKLQIVHEKSTNNFNWEKQLLSNDLKISYLNIRQVFYAWSYTRLLPNLDSELGTWYFFVCGCNFHKKSNLEDWQLSSYSCLTLQIGKLETFYLMLFKMRLVRRMIFIVLMHHNQINLYRQTYGISRVTFTSRVYKSKLII